MKPFVLLPLLASFLAIAPGVRSENSQQVAVATKQPELSTAGLRSLEHASKLIAAINSLDWKTVEEAFSPKDAWVDILKRDAGTIKDWPGIGGYRRYELNEKRSTLTLRFAYGPTHATPHEASFHYSLEGDKFKFTGMTIMGW